MRSTHYGSRETHLCYQPLAVGKTSFGSQDDLWNGHDWICFLRPVVTFVKSTFWFQHGSGWSASFGCMILMLEMMWLMCMWCLLYVLRMCLTFFFYTPRSGGSEGRELVNSASFVDHNSRNKVSLWKIYPCSMAAKRWIKMRFETGTSSPWYELEWTSL